MGLLPFTEVKTVVIGPSKKTVREELNRKTKEFLSKGGEIKRCDHGETGQPFDKPRNKSVFVSPSPSKTRTYLNDVISRLDSRKKKNKKPVVSKKNPPVPKKKIIYDDFGEPVREIWIDS